MFSDILRKDIRQYGARGVKFTPEDIVRLNALAVRVKLCQSPWSPVCLPRVVFLPPAWRWGRSLALREPTIAHELWIEEAARWIDTGLMRDFCYLHAFALSHLDPASLPDAFAPERVVHRVYMFAARRLVRYTMEQLRNAVDYVLYGADWTCGELPVQIKQSNNQTIRQSDNPSPVLGLLTRARAKRLPISLDDARRMTASELDEAITRAMVDAGEYDSKAARNDAMGDYVRTRDEIIERIRKENAAAPRAEERRDPSPDGRRS